jgi:hypothetical protein
MIQEHNIWRCI